VDRVRNALRVGQYALEFEKTPSSFTITMPLAAEFIGRGLLFLPPHLDRPAATLKETDRLKTEFVMTASHERPCEK
jgi:hypothetical protein